MKMTTQSHNKITPANPGFFQDILLRIKLIYRLMGDKRVNPFLKLLPIGAVIYFIVPDLAIGPLDDMAVMALASYLFIELCPDAVVAEHLRNLRLNFKPGSVENKDGDVVIDAEFEEKTGENKE
jgi:hypothetical protein